MDVTVTPHYLNASTSASDCAEPAVFCGRSWSYPVGSWVCLRITMKVLIVQVRIYQEVCVAMLSEKL